MKRRAKSTGHRAYSFILLGFVFLSFALYSLLFASFCHAANTQEEYKKIQKEIKTHREKLKKAQRRERSILTELDKTSKQLSLIEAELKKYRGRLRETELDISKVEAEIYLRKGSIEKQREWIKRRLRALQKQEHKNPLVMLLSSAEDISQLMKQWSYLQQIALYEHEILNSYTKTLSGLQDKEKQLMVLKAELVRSAEKVKAKEKDLAEKRKNKEIVLSAVRKQKSSYEKMLSELKEASRRLHKIIKKADTYRGKGFSLLKGKLPWPVGGRIAIPYGSHRDPQFHTPVFRSGIFIQTGGNISVRAVYTGKVVFAEWFKGYGQLMIVNHGDGYHTLYGSLSEIFSQAGDIINKGEVIGQVGNSGIHSEPGLYFELRYKGKPLDPIQWLRKR